MTTPNTDEFAQLRAQIVAQQARLERLEHSRGIPRRFLPLTLAILLVALMPLSILAAGFNDLNDGSIHNTNIQAITDAGITKGCDPGVSYCPNNLVTREELASFLARTAGLGDNPPIANAKIAHTVPDGSIGTAKLSPNGSTVGQVLTSTGSGVSWQSVGSGNGAPGPIGPQGPQGDKGDTGDAGMVGGYAPNALIRVNQATYDDVAILVGQYYAPLLSVALTAPGTGFILVTAALNVANGETSGAARFRLNDGERPAARVQVSVGTGAGYQRIASVTTTYVYPVTAGAKTFSLEGLTLSGTPYASDIVLTALYVPFGPVGDTP